MGRSALAKLGTTVRFIGSRLGTRRPPAENARATVNDALNAVPADVAKTRRLVDVPATADWVDTGIYCVAGDSVTLLAAGRIWLAEKLGVGFGANVALWYRIGDEPIAKSLGDTTSFVAGAAGLLRLVAKPPGEWLDDRGRFDPAQPRDNVTGGLTVGVIIWRDPAALEAVAGRAGGLLAREVDRRRDWVEPPAGWTPLWRLGHGPIYRAAEIDGRPAIACRTHGDVGILRRPADMALDATTTLGWSWRVRQLPSPLPEDIQPTHDYLSIAAEFDNGRDLTYMWSRSLAAESSFACPLPWWCDRETHLVLRSGEAGIGDWHDEARPLLEDYRRAIGGPDPARVVAVWLIAVSVFQGGTGEADYAAIRLSRDRELFDLL